MNKEFIRAIDVDFTYPDGTKVLNGINLAVDKGEFVSILGANGSGKTTLLKLLNRLLKNSSGTICLEGENINKINKDLYFRRVCTMFQNPNDQLFAPTVYEDVSFGPVNMGLKDVEVKERVMDSLEAVDMAAYKNKAIHSLSFGQKKRISLAGVLAMDPEVILLDEPTSCLDPVGVRSIMKLLKSLSEKKGITMIMATHVVDLIPMYIGKVVVLEKGAIFYSGSPRETFSDPELIRKAKLRMPWIGHLFELLKFRDGLRIDDLPLTVGEAREQVKDFCSS